MARTNCWWDVFPVKTQLCHEANTAYMILVLPKQAFHDDCYLSTFLHVQAHHSEKKGRNDFPNLLLHLFGGSFLTEMTQNPLGNKSYGPYKYAAITSVIKILTLLLWLS